MVNMCPDDEALAAAVRAMRDCDDVAWLFVSQYIEPRTVEGIDAYGDVFGGVCERRHGKQLGGVSVWRGLSRES